MVYVFEKLKVDDKEMFTIRETSGRLLVSSTDPQKLVDFYSSLSI